MTKSEAASRGTQLETVSHTEPGLVLGTVPYMSPEQAPGKPVDARSDIFSLGSVLYELSCGRRPFSGKTSAELIDQITHSQPAALARFNYDIPVEFERIVRKCLEKDPDERYQSAKDLLIDLRTLRRDTISGTRSGETQNQKPRALSIKAVPAIIAIALFALAGVLFYLKSSSRPAIRSIAVLPFVNRTGDEKAEYLSDGISESTINNLSQLSELRVIARSTVFSYKGKQLDPRKIGQELDVDGVVTGTVSQQGDNLIVQADLMNVREGSQVWGQQFNRKISDILALQSDISSQISQNLQLRLTGKERQRVIKQYTDNSEAYRLYLQGIYLWNKASDESARKSIQYFQMAIDEDPLYARAYAGLSDAYGILAMLGYMPSQEAWSKSKAAALKALEIDSELAQAHVSLGTNYMFYAQEWKNAETELLRAAASPNFAEAHHILYIYYGATGNTQEAVKQILLARKLDPLSILIADDTGWAYYINRDYPRALLETRKVLEMDPNYESALFQLAYIYLAMKDYPKAIEAAEKGVAVSNRGPFLLGTLGYALGRAGKTSQAQEILAELKKRSGTSFISPYHFGLVHVGLGQKDEAFRLIHQACELHTGDWGLLFIKSDPAMDILRSDPRFADLLACMNLPQ